MMSAILFLFYFIKIPMFSQTDPDNRLENIIEAFYQIYNNIYILWGVLGIKQIHLFISILIL
jgi:hypothetical protein